jgi:hypothetical protein
LHVEVSNATPHQIVALDEKKHFSMSWNRRLRQIMKELKPFRSVRHVPAGQFANDARVAKNFPSLYEFVEPRIRRT